MDNTTNKHIVGEGYFTPSRTWTLYSDGMVLFNKDGLYYYVYEDMTAFANGEEIKQFTNEEEAYIFLQEYNLPTIQ